MLVAPAEERRLTTILFADLSGFTALATGSDPEDVRDIANTCFEFLNAAIQKHGGTIHKYDGDLVIALFGMPTAHEDDPEQAVTTALDMMACLPDMNRALSSRMKKAMSLGLHVGISSGIVIFGHVGTKVKTEFTAMGEVVNLASRLKDSAKDGEILVSEAVFRASRYLFDFEVVPPIALKGIQQEVKIYRPLRIKAKPNSKRGLTGLHAPMVGRDRELGALEDAVRRLSFGQGGVFFVLGDAGLGKSRLMAELKTWLGSARLTIAPSILEGRCLSYGETLPYWPFLAILRSIFGLGDHDSTDELKEKVIRQYRAVAGEHGPELMPYLGYLLSISFGADADEKIRHLDPQMLQLQIMVSIKRLLTDLTGQQSLILVIEDYHWIDAASLALLEFIVDMPRIERLLVVCLSRIEKEKAFHVTKEKLKRQLGDRFREVALQPLDASQCERLLDNLLSTPGFPTEFKERVIARAEGNPFYLEEIVRSLIDRGVLRRQADGWRVTADAARLEIPDTMQALTAARVDRLEQDAKEILQVAAVIGRSFPARLVEAVSGVDSLMLSLHLATLDEHEYIQVLQYEPELEYVFRHPIMQEVVYNGLLKRRRREVHRRTAEMIEQLYRGRLEELTEQLAHHYANGDDLDRAIELLRKAGDRARQRYANDEAIRYFNQIVEIIGQMAETSRTDHARSLWAAIEDLGDVYGHKSEYTVAMACFDRLYEVAREDGVVRCRSRRKKAEMLVHQGNFEAALSVAGEAEKTLIGDSAVELVEKAEIMGLRSWVYRIKGDLDQAVAKGEQGLSIIDSLERMHDPGVPDAARFKLKAKLARNLGVIFYTKNDLEKAVALYEQSLAISDRSGEKQGIAAAYGNLGIIYRKKGEFTRAIESLQKYLSISEQVGDRQKVGLALGNLGVVMRDLGDDNRALELFKKYLEIAEEIGDRQRIGIASGNAGVIYHERGDYVSALAYFKRAYDLAMEIDDKQGIVMTAIDLGGLYHEQGRSDAALELFTGSLSIAMDMKDILSAGQLHLLLGEIHVGKGKPAAAQQHLIEAQQQLRASMEKLEGQGEKLNLLEVYAALARAQVLLAEIKVEEAGKALPYLEKGFELARLINSRPVVANYHLIFGQVYSLMTAHEKARHNFQSAIEIFESIGHNKSLADACLGLGKSLRASGPGPQSAEAGQYLDRALNIYQSINLPDRAKEVEEHITGQAV